MLDHGIEDGEQLVHAGGEGHLLGFACLAEAPVEDPNYRVAASGHVEGCSHGGSSTPHRALAPQGPAVPVKWGHPGQSRDLFASQGAQFRQVGQEGQRQDRTNPRDASEQVLLLSPEGAILDGVPKLLVQLSQLPFQPKDVGLEPLAYLWEGCAKPVSYTHLTLPTILRV